MYLSKNFTLAEMTRSATADRLGIDNSLDPNNAADAVVIGNLIEVCENILQPIRDIFDRPFSPSSAYRCLDLNRALRSSDASQHVKGQAVDIELAGVPNLVLAHTIAEAFDFDQLLLEFYKPEDPTSGWVHISYAPNNRRQVLTISRTGVTEGLPEIDDGEADLKHN